MSSITIEIGYNSDEKGYSIKLVMTNNGYLNSAAYEFRVDIYKTKK